MTERQRARRYSSGRTHVPKGLPRPDQAELNVLHASLRGAVVRVLRCPAYPDAAGQLALCTDVYAPISCAAPADNSVLRVLIAPEEKGFVYGAEVAARDAEIVADPDAAGRVRAQVAEHERRGREHQRWADGEEGALPSWEQPEAWEYGT